MNQQNMNRPPLAIWGGLECTINRVGDRYFSQAKRNGHAERPDDIERFAGLGIQAMRYPVLWEQVAPDGIEQADWALTDVRLSQLRDNGIAPILGLVHHGSGPRHTSLVDPAFADGLAHFAGAVAQRYPWAEHYTVVNEPLTTARFACLYGFWYPHARDDAAFLRALLVQCRATILSMQAIRAVNPAAKLIQTDDLGKTYGTEVMQDVCEFYNERRWLGWDLLCGMVDSAHPLWAYCMKNGASSAELAWFRANACPPDIIGVNYYVTSERWLDHRVEQFPPSYCGTAGPIACADIEASRSMAAPIAGVGPLLEEAWQRYGIPIAITEVHIDAHREDQLRWLVDVWHACENARRKGVDVRALTVWSLLGAFDWNSLVTAEHGYYESGAFDLRGEAPRPTALAGMMAKLARGEPPSHPVLHGKGWWRRPDRFLCPPVAALDAVAPLFAHGHGNLRGHAAPILISGATGTLGRAFARLCKERQLTCVVLGRKEMDIADAASVEAAIAHYRPWALVNASGYVRVDDAETDRERCWRENTTGPAVLASACARHNIHFTTFSSDLVFDGTLTRPYLESDAVNPLGVYGASKAAAEQSVAEILPAALVVRTGAFFGPWDSYNFVHQALEALADGARFSAVSDLTVTPTYVPDLVNCCLDLIIDAERGIWHLTNGTAVTWSELASRAAGIMGIDSASLHETTAQQCAFAARRPVNSVLASERGMLMPTLDDALRRYVAGREAASTAGAPEQHYALYASADNGAASMRAI